MKLLKSLIIPAVLTSVVLASCGIDTSEGEPAAETPTETPEEAPAETPEETPAETSEPEETEPAAEVSSEQAMDNFLAKVEAGNYTINAENFLKTTVASNDEVIFDYVDDAYNDFAVMSVDNETFQGFLKDGALSEISFIGEGQAVEAAKTRLLNYWTDVNVSDGNIYNLFYNSVDEPLTFMSKEEVLKRSVMSFVGYGENALRLMHEVYMVMDAEDPTEVHLKAEMDDDVVARVSYDDIDVVVTFGDAETNAAADKWMSSPEYPEAKTEWDDTDIFIFNSVFLPGYGEEAIPFTPFASYALSIDEANFVADDEVRIRDSHATKADLKEYIEVLKENGFEEVKEKREDGSEKVYFRKLLREAYKCYSSIELDYEDGIDLIAKKYYDCPSYEGLAEINKAIEPFGYPALPESKEITSAGAVDDANEMTESWLYFFHYDLGLYAKLQFSSEEAAQEYMKAYEEAAKKTEYAPVYVDDTEEIDRFESANGFASMRYKIEDDLVTILYKSEVYTAPEEAAAKISEAGFPAIELSEPITFRDLREYQKASTNQDHKAYYTVSQTYDSAAKAEEFLSAYEEALTEEGYGRVAPGEAGTLKPIAIYNEDTGMLVGIDFIEQDGGAIVNFDFKAE